MPTAFLVAGLGYGDEGKGTTVEWLVARHQVQTVVRYNGGAQAAHNVVTDDGRHHTFSQFGSGTFVGAHTHLSRFMLVDPLALIPEAEHLASLGIREPLDLLTIEREALMITPWHRAVNRLRESLRGGARHGSCGLGIGETVHDALQHGRERMPMIGDLLSPARLREKLEHARAVNIAKLPPDITAPAELLDLLASPVDAWLHRYLEIGSRLRIVGREFLPTILRCGNTVFEGAQGVLLDQAFGFHPYTTWSDVTFSNALALLADGPPVEVERIGVLRTHSTRHGAGPFVTERPDLDAREFDEFNARGPWQGRFRVGPLDLVATQYALEVLGGVDSLAITHADRSLPEVCTSYVIADGDDIFFESPSRIHVQRPANLEYQAALGLALFRSRPVLTSFDAVGALEATFQLPIRIVSFGPRLQDKRPPPVRICTHADAHDPPNRASSSGVHHGASTR
jgi:adenylosuccinate synthase